jgi:hypothetical protein
MAFLIAIPATNVATEGFVFDILEIIGRPHMKVKRAT